MPGRNDADNEMAVRNSRNETLVAEGGGIEHVSISGDADVAAGILAACRPRAVGISAGAARPMRPAEAREISGSREIMPAASRERFLKS